MDTTQLLNDVLQQYDVVVEHSPNAYEEVQRWQAAPDLDDPKLLDWRTYPFVTIDNEDSRDLDQAILIEPHDTGYRCLYALADASHYVRPGTALFAESLVRGSSYYLPGQSVPMLPVALSEELVSLNPNVQRRALVFDMTLTKDGVCTHTDIVRARIQSIAKLSYAGVQRMLDNTSADGDTVIPQAAMPSLQLFKTLGLSLIERAIERDVVQFDRRETEIHATQEGFDLRTRERYDTERYNEQISLLCNMQGAKLLQSMDRIHPDLQPIFRIHEAPLKRRTAELATTLSALSEARNLDARFRQQPDQSMADFVAALPDDAANKRLVQAIERQVLMTNQASRFRAEPGRHHALGATSYARFSSPMREIVGIYTHKELLEALGVIEPMNPDEDDQIRHQVIEAANTAKQRQKQIGKAIEFAVINNHLQQDLNEASPHTHSGTVMGIRGKKIYIAIDDLAVDLKVYLEDLSTQYQTPYTVTGISAVPEDSAQPLIVLGDSVTLDVRDFDKENRRYRLNLYPG